MFERPLTWHEKLGKTIAMIHASSDYQRYIKQKQHRTLMKEFRPTGVGRFSAKMKMPNACGECGDFLSSGRRMRLCKICLGQAIISLYRSGLSTEQVSTQLACNENTVVKYLRLGTGNKNPTLSLDQMMSVGTKPDRTRYELVR